MELKRDVSLSLSTNGSDPDLMKTTGGNKTRREHKKSYYFLKRGGWRWALESKWLRLRSLGFAWTSFLLKQKSVLYLLLPVPFSSILRYD
jgi:hypothetical protein